MKLLVQEKCDIRETEVIIRCQERDEEVDNLIIGIHSATKKIIGEKENGCSYQVSAVRVLYFEAVEGNVFAYLDKEVMRVRNTLYEIEESYSNNHFVRISKSAAVNLRAIKSISPDEGRRLRIRLTNNENLVVSKNYVSALKKSLGMKEGSR